MTPLWRNAFYCCITLAVGVATPARGEPVAGIHVLDRVALPTLFGEVKIREISGLAWDADEQLLYAVSDRGHLYHFRLTLSQDKISALSPVFSTRVLGGTADAGRARPKNAEGLDVKNADNGRQGDSELLIAFEDGPAIERFTPDGRRIAGIALPHPLADKNNYSADNNRIEAVAVSATEGVLAAAEKPLLGQDEYALKIFATSGKSWSFRRDRGVGIKAIEALADGNILVLERKKGSDGVLTPSLRVIGASACAASSPCVVAALPVLSGAFPEANFEGLARVGADRFVMVTDTNKSSAEPATLLLFRIEFAKSTQ